MRVYGARVPIGDCCKAALALGAGNAASRPYVFRVTYLKTHCVVQEEWSTWKYTGIDSGHATVCESKNDVEPRDSRQQLDI